MLDNNNWALPDGWVLPGYEHLRELGSGGGGYVWLARHRVTGTLVAVKYLVPGLYAAADFREAYRAEAQLLAKLRSAHIARLYEYVEGPPGAAIVMEAVEGASLRALMKQEDTAAASPEAALCILKGSLLGLAEAHDAGVVHRDYKPANVLVTPDGVSKLVDFGIAARTGSAAAAAGTPSYMAPEQFHGAPASPSSDVYAATVTFFECVTGERPFPGTNAIELMAQHALGGIPDDLAPPPVRALIRKGMAKDPRERPASAREFLGRLEAVADAAYGPDWERRGQHKLATLLALMPLLLLRTAAQAVPSSTTSVATTVLGEEPIIISVPPVVPEPDGRHPHHGGRRRRRSRSSRIGRRSAGLSVGAVALGVMMVIAGAAVAAYAAYRPPSPHENSAALTSATTQVTADSTVPFTLTPMPSPDMSTSASPTPSLSASPTATSTATPSASASASASGTSSATSSATTSLSASASPSPAEISSLTVHPLTCTAAYTVEATIDAVSNGQGGTLTLAWFYETVNGSQEPVATTTYDLPAGQTSQTVTPSPEDFSQYSDYPAWGVTVSSSPTSDVTQAQPISATAGNCQPVIQ